jgi:hypothetical protein
MQNPTQVSPQEFVESLKEQTDAYLKSVMEAVNLAPDGKWIAGSEEEVRDLSEDYRRQVFQAAVQQRIDAAEAAFSPSAGNGHRSGNTTTGHQTTPQ